MRDFQHVCPQVGASHKFIFGRSLDVARKQN